MKRWLLLIVGVWLLVGCSQTTAITRQQRQIDGLTVTFEHPERLVINQDYTLVVQLHNAASQSISDAQVFLDLTMPAMPMGMNQPIADNLGDGRYQVRTVYTMEGLWQINVHVTQDGRERVASFYHDVFLP